MLILTLFAYIETLGYLAPSLLHIRTDGTDDLEVRFIRLIGLDPPALFADGFESGNLTAWSSGAL